MKLGNTLIKHSFLNSNTSSSNQINVKISTIRAQLENLYECLEENKFNKEENEKIFYELKNTNEKIPIEQEQDILNSIEKFERSHRQILNNIARLEPIIAKMEASIAELTAQQNGIEFKP
jgi:hypothetical protein